MVTNKLKEGLKLFYFSLFNKNGIKNFLTLVFAFTFKKKGKFVCPNGFVLDFDKNNFYDILRVYLFSLIEGVKFNNELKGYWKYKNGIITTPNGIKIKSKSFNRFIFAETFLYDIHFCDFDLHGKTVVQAGGFVGDTALYYAARGAKVYSFEPEPNLYRLGLENIALNPKLSKNIIFKNYAIGKDELIEFPLVKSVSGGASAYSLENRQTVKVKSLSISTILKIFKINEPFILDLDIKGKEFEVIEDPSISKFKIVRIEFSPKIGNIKIGERNYLIKKLKEYGFKEIRIYKHSNGVYDLNDNGTIEAKK
ncbi:MAG: FkbM family methyltransferase [Minisyncoccia bacterium]